MEKNDFAHCSEILGLIIKNKVNFQEIPIQVNYDQYSRSKSVKPGVGMGWKLLFDKLFE